MEKTYWNGLPTSAIQGSAVVADSPQHPNYWARREDLLGSRIDVVEVVLDKVNFGGGIIYIDNRNGFGWVKVTEGRGSPRYGHRSVEIVEGTFQVDENSTS